VTALFDSEWKVVCFILGILVGSLVFFVGTSLCFHWQRKRKQPEDERANEQDLVHFNNELVPNLPNEKQPATF